MAVFIQLGQPGTMWSQNQLWNEFASFPGLATGIKIMLRPLIRSLWCLDALWSDGGRKGRCGLLWLRDFKKVSFGCGVLIYSCFEKGCPTKANKRDRAWRWLIEAHGVYQQVKSRHKYICLSCFPLCRWRTLSLNQGPWTVITHNTFGIVA